MICQRIVRKFSGIRSQQQWNLTVKIRTFHLKIIKIPISMLQKATLKHISKYIDQSSQLLLRADFNVPIKENQIIDPTRIQATLPTIRTLLSRNPKSLVILSHLGRPEGKKNLKYTMRPVADYLETSLGRKVTFLEDCVGENVINQVNNAEGEIFLCENVRFHPEEEASLKKSSPELILKTKNFRQQLSRLGNIYINDAFGAAHRNHSSVAGITHKIRAAGLLMQKQINYLGGFIQKPKKPVLAVLGGAKVVDKLQLISKMIDVADQIIIGGGMVHPFLQQIFGFNLGGTKVQLPHNKQLLHKVLNKARLKNGRIHFPFDCVAAKQMKTGIETRVFDLIKGIPDGWQAFDIGPKSTRIFKEYIKRSNSIFWNGPVGVFQIPQFSKGSSELMKAVANRTREGATSIIGGGDSVNLVNSLGLSQEVSFISTGGGASLELMQGNSMPGIDNLTNVSDLEKEEILNKQYALSMIV